MKIMICVLFSLCTLWAQDAVVVELHPNEAAQMKALHEAKIKADKAWDVAYSRLLTKYTEVSPNGEFSKDFRFIVPKPWSAPITWNTNCIIASPAVSPSVVSPAGIPLPGIFISN